MNARTLAEHTAMIEARDNQIWGILFAFCDFGFFFTVTWGMLQ